MSEKSAKGAAARAAAVTDAPPPIGDEPGDAPEFTTEAVDAALEAAGSPDDFKNDLVSRLVARHMPSGKNALQAGDIIKRRQVTFEMDGVECEPGMFVNDAGEYITFKITMESLDSAGELLALQGLKDGAGAPLALAKASFKYINGQRLDENRKNFFWEALGMGGRQICMVAVQSLGAASESALGKYLSSRSESS